MAVREGEQRAVAMSQSIPESWKGQMEKAMSGGAALGPEIREGLKRLAMRSYEGHKTQYDEAKNFYEQQAMRIGLDPSSISYMGESTPTEQVMGQGGAAPDKDAWIRNRAAEIMTGR
jgi:hypothetical protein